MGNDTSHNIAILRQKVEESADIRIKTSTDFALLSGMIRERVKSSLGISTLKRLWGYVENSTTAREDTLNILSRFVGYPDWETFVSDYCETDSAQSSHRVLSPSLTPDDIAVGGQVAIAWNPGRECLLQRVEGSKFLVVRSEKSKLKPGDTFYCTRFIMNQPLILDRYVHHDHEPGLFVVANKGGLTKIEIVEDE